MYLSNPIQLARTVPADCLPTLRTGPVLENSNECKNDSGEFGQKRSCKHDPSHVEEKFNACHRDGASERKQADYKYKSKPAGHERQKHEQGCIDHLLVSFFG